MLYDLKACIETVFCKSNYFTPVCTFLKFCIAVSKPITV